MPTPLGPGRNSTDPGSRRVIDAIQQQDRNLSQRRNNRDTGWQPQAASFGGLECSGGEHQHAESTARDAATESTGQILLGGGGTDGSGSGTALSPGFEGAGS